MGIGLVWVLLMDELRVGFQIAYQRVTLREGKVGLGGGLAQKSLNVLEPPGPASQCLVTGCVDSGGGVFAEHAA